MTGNNQEKAMNPAKVVLAFCLSASLVGCSNMSSTEKRTLGGAGIGVASGALIGELATGRPLQGAAIGAVAGAVGGWLYDRHEKGEGL
jgi:osmotically inducible lipoprotein OsmB